MPYLLDLSCEVLQNIPLHSADLKNIILTCRILQLCFEPILYRDLSKGWRHKTSEITKTEYKDLHRLLDALERRTVRFGYIQSLNLIPRPCECIPRCLILQQSFHKMRNLRVLELESCNYDLLKIQPPLPNLENLYVCGEMGDRRYEWSPSVLKVLTKLQPTLRHLIISYGSFSLEEPPEDHFLLMDHPASMLEKCTPSNLVEIQWLNSDISPDCLKEIFNQQPGLRSFAHTRFMYSHNGKPWEDWTLYDIGMVLHQFHDRLTNLGIFHGNCFRIRNEIGLLPSLAQFSSLKHIKIDPAILLGRHAMDREDGEGGEGGEGGEDIPVRPISKFASMLPASLQILTLCIDLYQCSRVRHYRKKLLEGLLADRLLLSQLERITLLELNWMSTDHEVDDRWMRSDEIRGLEMTAEEMYAFWNLREKFFAAGVALDLHDFQSENPDEDGWHSLEERRYLA